MKTQCVAFFLSFALCTLVHTNARGATNQTSRQTADIWQACRSKLAKALDLEERRDHVPEKSWLGTDQGDIDGDINELLDEILVALELSDLTRCRDEYAQLEAEIHEAKARITGYIEKRAFAPEDAPMLNPFVKSRDDYEKLANELRKKVAETEAAQAELIDELQAAYESIGVELSREQVAFYLSSISGEDIVALSAVYQNVAGLDAKLSALMQEEPDSPQVAKRYYGVHVVLIRSVVQAHDNVLARITDRYMPKVKELSTLNDEAAEETAQLMREAPRDQRRILQSSARMQTVTRQALQVYDQHLRDLHQRVDRGRKSLHQRYLVARNAYKTIMVASVLATEMRACLRDLNTLQNMHLPALLPIEDDAIRIKFAEITAALAE